MKERYRVEQYPSWVEEKMSSSKALRRKKRSLWSWAPIRAIAKIGQQQFYCVFSIFVQMIDGLPSSLDSLRLVVQLERNSKIWQTMPSRVFQRIAEFDETLHIETTIFGRESNMQDHVLKFMPKDYVLSVVAIDASEHFLFNQHRIDLSRLLPTSVEGFWEPDKPMSSTASFKLGGKAEGAALVATFDFEVLNEEFRKPSLLIDGNASARFKGSSLRQVSRAVKSLPNSPNSSPFVRRPNYHFTSPCTSDVESTDSPCIEKFELDSSAKETEECSAHDYSSSDEERYRALRNDPLYLDAFGETESTAFSSSVKVQEGIGSLDGFNAQSYPVKADCVEKIKVFLSRRTKSDTDTLSHQMDVRTLLNCGGPEEVGVASQRKQENGEFYSHNGVHVQERYIHLGELAADCVEKLEISSARRSKSDVPINQIDVLRLLDHQKAEEVNIIFQSKKENNKSSHETSHEIHEEVLERKSYAGDLAADKFCINVEIAESCPTSGSNGMMSPDENLQGKCFTGGIMLSPSFVRSKSSDSNHEVLTSEEVEAFSEVNEKHMLFEVIQDSFPETSPGLLKGAQAAAPEIFSSATLQSQDESEVCVEVRTDADVEVAAGHFRKDLGFESGLGEGLKVLAVSVGEVGSTCSESSEDVELDIFQFGAEDEELSLEANVVAEHFLNFLEREEENICTSSSEAVVPELSSSERLSLTDDPSPVAQEVMDLYVSTSELAKLNVIPSCHQARSEAFNHAEEVSENCASETSFEDDTGLLCMIKAAESEMKKAAQTRRSKERAKLLEDAEAKALMEKWGLTDKAFESSSLNMFQCPTPQGRQTSESTSIIRLKDGGSLKVMNSSQQWGNLVMQASRPVVIPSTSSACIADILGSIASQGLENMTSQAFLRMPLEDIMGLSMEHFEMSDIVAENGGHNCSSTISPLRQGSSQGHTMRDSSAVNGGCIECHGFKPLDLEEVVSVDDLTHTALRRIEPLAVEGLKVQCNLSKAAPDSVHIRSLATDKESQVSTDVIHTSFHLDDRAHTQVSSAKSLLDMTLSLDDWLHMCEGAQKIECETQLCLETSEKDEYSKVDNVLESPTRASFSDNLTVAMLVQLRDPLRYYEPVGTSMMALVQAKRINPRVFMSSVSENESDGASNIVRCAQGFHGTKSGINLQITGVHMSGVQLSEDDTNKSWGNKEQLQSGSRWLVANSRANQSRHVLPQSSTKAEMKAKAEKGEFLWSISARVHTSGISWRDTEDACPYIRNPDLTFATDEAF